MTQYFCQCFISFLLVNDLKLIFFSSPLTKKPSDVPAQFFFSLFYSSFCQRFKIRFQLPQQKKASYARASTCICENRKYLKIIIDTSVTECDEIITVMDTVSTKKTNVTSTVSINCHSVKVKDCYILHTVLIAIILLFVIIIICYHYAKQKGII